MEEMRVFADQLWKYFEPKLKDAMALQVGYFRAEVVSNPGDGALIVKRPFESENLTLPCTNAMAGASAGDQVIAFTLGSMSNAVVVADSRMNLA
jgi:hypothetical protein